MPPLIKHTYAKTQNSYRNKPQTQRSCSLVRKETQKKTATAEARIADECAALRASAAIALGGQLHEWLRPVNFRAVRTKSAPQGIGWLNTCVSNQDGVGQ